MFERILLVDDEKSITEIYQDILTKSGYQVSVASTAEEAIKHLTAQSFDLLITDIRLPGKDGISLLKEVNQIQKDLPRIVITGYGTLQNATEAISQGVNRFLLKPLNPKEMAESIVSALEGLN
jgi:DNA-binding NtrC family response regulator